MLNFIELLKVVLLGVIEGITEWLPISSTGHMLLFDEFVPLNMTEAFKEMFFVVIQLGAIIAVIACFFSKMNPIKVQDKKLSVNSYSVSIWKRVIVACLPSAVGIFLDDFFEEHFGGAVSIAAMLIIYGILFIIIEQRNKGRTPKIQDVGDITYRYAFIIGCFQVLAMIPGTSRSGATIVGALLLGISRTAAAEFTFFLAVPTMVAASGLKLIKFGFAFTSEEVIVLLLGMAVAFVVSLITIRFLMNYVKKHTFTSFGIYRIVLGAAVLICHFFI